MAKIIIEIDEELKHKVMMKAVFEKMTMKKVVTTLLKDWINDGRIKSKNKSKSQ